jgi:hypothetical protein
MTAPTQSPVGYPLAERLARTKASRTRRHRSSEPSERTSPGKHRTTQTKRAAIELVIVNRGRAPGIIDQVSVPLPDGRIDVGAVFDGFPEG